MIARLLEVVTPEVADAHDELTHGRLLCPRHHARARDYEMTKLPDGKVAFHRGT